MMRLFPQKRADNSNSNSRRCSSKRSFLRVTGKIQGGQQTMLRSSYCKGKIMYKIHGYDSPWITLVYRRDYLNLKDKVYMLGGEMIG